MEILTILATIILPLLIGFVLGKTRDNGKVIFNKKLEIYSDIVYHLSSAKYLRLNLDISLDKIDTLVSEMNSSQERVTEKSRSDRETEINQKLSGAKDDIKLLDYRDNLIKLFAPARLLGSRAVVDELREYFSLISEYHLIKEKQDIENLSKKISKSVMELEQLMRKDLGHFRLLSKLDIWWHLRKD